jgi:hypothetical protein
MNPMHPLTRDGGGKEDHYRRLSKEAPKRVLVPEGTPGASRVGPRTGDSGHYRGR